jgi:hypothetical protein
MEDIGTVHFKLSSTVRIQREPAAVPELPNQSLRIPR